MKDDIRQARAAGNRVGLTPEQMYEYLELIHEVKLRGENLTWQELIELAEEVKRDWQEEEGE